MGLALASNTQTSSLAAISTTALLKSAQLESVIATNSERLTKACNSLAALLRTYDIPYFPCYAGLYIFARLAPKAQYWEDESVMLREFKDAGISISGGRGYHVGEENKGWARISFAVNPKTFQLALERLERVLSSRRLGPADVTT